MARKIIKDSNGKSQLYNSVIKINSEAGLIRHYRDSQCLQQILCTNSGECKQQINQFI